MPDRKRVYLALLTARQEYQQQQLEEARAAAARAALELEVEYAENDPATQLRQLEAQVRRPAGERPAAIVVETAATVGFEAVARSALSARIGWVVISARGPYLELLRRDFPSGLVTSATTDDLEIGRLMARHWRALLPGGGKVLSLEGPPANAAAIFRRRMADQELRGSGVSVVHALPGDWTAATTERAVAAWLAGPGKDAAFDLCGAQNDEMALGARAALRTARPAFAGPFTGCDGLPGGGQRYLREGLIAATIVRPTTAGPGVELAGRALRGEPVPPHLVLPARSMPPLEDLGRS